MQPDGWSPRSKFAGGASNDKFDPATGANHDNQPAVRAVSDFARGAGDVHARTRHGDGGRWRAIPV
jgi:hypothetical protein